MRCAFSCGPLVLRPHRLLVYRGVEPEHVAHAQPVGPTTEEVGDRDSEAAADDIPEGHVDRGLGRGVADRAVEALVDRGAVECRAADDLGGEQALDHGDDRLLGLAVGERPRRGLRGADDALVGVDADEDVLGG